MKKLVMDIQFFLQTEFGMKIQIILIEKKKQDKNTFSDWLLF